MLFFSPWMLIGLAGVLVPVMLHLIRKQAARPYDWGAMRFLLDTVVARRKKMEWEDLLLLATRCLFLALCALALAQPYVPPGSRIPWFLVLPLVLAGIVGFGISFVPSRGRRRWSWRGLAVLCLIAAAALIWWEEKLSWERFQSAGRRDVALVIDGSTSMDLQSSGATAFSRAVAEARELVRAAPRGTAFSLILGGPAPERIIGSPITRKADILDLLEKLEPSGGPFRARDAIGVATLTLAEGMGSQKDVVVFSDGQRHGWQLEEPAAWSGLEEAWEGLGDRPRLLLRRISPPPEFQNLSVGELSFSRDVVGMDRPVRLRVPVTNTGTGPVTPGELIVSVPGSPDQRKGMRQLIPGEETMMEFDVQFSQAGPQVVSARLEGQDHLEGDNSSSRVISVREELKVLLVEGNPGAEFFSLSTGYLAVALTPGHSGSGSWLMNPEVVEAVDLVRLDLSDVDVMVLGSVPRLPSVVAARVSRFVAQGGGLLILSGPNCESDFYRTWSGADGLVVPARFGQWIVPPDGVTVASASFEHPALHLLQGRAGAGLNAAVVSSYIELGEMIDGGVKAAAFSNGAPFLVSRTYGAGRMMVSTTAWDGRAGSLPGWSNFVPMVHEVVSWLGGGRALDLNVTASWSPSIGLPGGGGLRGRYFKQKNREREFLFERIDDQVSFDWQQGGFDGGPKDGFAIEWSGGLVPKETGSYELELEADDEATLELGGREFLSANVGQASQTIKLTAGRYYRIGLRYREDWGEAKVHFRWRRPDGVSEPVPGTVLVSLDRADEEFDLGTSQAVDPRAMPREVKVIQGRRGRSIKVAGPAIPGVYQVGLPLNLDSELPKTLPMVVKREEEESIFETFSADDLDFLRKEMNLVEVGSADDALAVFRGQGFGQELWAVLLVAAIVVFFLEGMLARWVTRNRQVGEDDQLKFENRGQLDQEVLSAIKEGRP